MWQAITDGTMPDFWPPRPSRFWQIVFEPFRRWYLHQYYGISAVSIDGGEQSFSMIQPADGVLIAPNHSHDSDPHVMMEVGRRLGRTLYFMAAWQIFRPHWGIDGFCLQRLGAFSVDREGCDRRAVKQAVEILTTGKNLVVFPEGEVFRLNERLTPLLEGVAFMALTAQRELGKLDADSTAAAGLRRVWIMPASIRYKYVDDIQLELSNALNQIETRMLSSPPHGALLHERIIRAGELILTIKEKEKLGQSREHVATLPERIAYLIEELLKRHESTFLKKSPADTVPLRVKALRRHLLEIWNDETAAEDVRHLARAGLDDVHLVLQLFSYPGDYVSERPSTERIAETIEKFEEDLTGAARPKGKRAATVRFGGPIDLRAAAAAGRPRTVAADVTDQLEKAIKELMAAAASQP